MSQEEIERNFAFIVNQQAKFFADIEELKVLAVQRNIRLDRIDKLIEFIDRQLTSAIRLRVAEDWREREKRRQLETTFAAKLSALINAQARTAESLCNFKPNITATNQRTDNELSKQNGQP